MIGVRQTAIWKPWAATAAGGGGGRAAAEAAAAGGGGGRDRSGGDQLPAPRDARRRVLRFAVSPNVCRVEAPPAFAMYKSNEPWVDGRCSAAGGARFVWAAGLAAMRAVCMAVS